MNDFVRNEKTGVYQKKEGDYMYELTWQQYWAAKLFLKGARGSEIATEWYRSLDFQERKAVRRTKISQEDDGFYPDHEYQE